MTVDVYAYDQNSSGTTFSKFVFIEAGKSSGTYTLTVPPETSASWRVYYSYYGTEAYLQSGYYSPAGTQWLYDQAVTLPGGTDHSDINLALLTGNTITGTVSLPPDRTAPEGGMSIGVSATNHYGSVAVDASAFIEAGQSSGTFSLIVPSDASTSWRVRYSYWGNGGYRGGSVRSDSIFCF